MENLKTPLSRYIAVSKKLTEINAAAAELRDERRTAELDLAAAYNEHRDLPGKIELTQSHMTFVVKKPGDWKKGWNLSKKQLQEYLLDILPEHGPDVLREIVRRHERTLIADDYAFEIKPAKIENTAPPSFP